MKHLAAGLLIFLILIVALIGGTMAIAETSWFADLLARRVSASLQRKLDVAGPLQIDWSLHPRIHIPALTLANPGWADAHPMAHISSLEVTLSLPALLRGRVDLTNLLLTEPYFVLARNQAGQRNWDGLTGEQGKGGPFQLQLDMVRIKDGRLYYADFTQALKMDLNVHTEAGNDLEQLRVTGHGSRHGKPFELNLKGGPLLAITDTHRPYPVSGWLHAGKTALEGQGTLRQPLSPQSADFQLTLQGPNPADLHDLLGLALPDLPPYQLSGKLTFEQGIWQFQKFSGQVGDSDLAGTLSIQPGKPLKLEAELTSQRLDLNDVLPAFGAAPGTGKGETASGSQQRQAKAEQSDPDVLPKAPPDRSRLLGVDATVRFLGKHVDVQKKIPLDQVSFTLQLKEGVLHFDPLNFGTGGGTVDSQLVLDVRQKPTQGQLKARMQDVDLGKLLKDFGVPKGGFGTIRGSLESRFSGETVKQAFASSKGELLMYMTKGQVDAVLVSLAGMDAGRALIEQIFGSEPTEIECAFTHVIANDGQAKIDRFLIATKNIDLTAAGAVDLRHEKLDIVLRGYPRSPSFGASDSPIHVSGRFADAKVSIVSAELLERGALSALAALLAPPLALLPFLNPGSGDNKEDVCARLTAEAKKIEAGVNP